MRRISHCDLWRRTILSAAIFATGVMASAIEARAVILYSTDVRNTTTPSADEGADAWNLEATWGDYLATPIDATHFIAAQHVQLASNTLTFQGATYTVDPASRTTDPNSDLCIYSIVGGTFPTYAPLYNADPNVNGSEVGKTLTVIGRGRQRGGPVSVGSDLKGWYWGDADLVQSWGQNVVTGFADFSTNPSAHNSLLYFTFDENGIPNEAMVSQFDSSGGVFIYSNGQWKLAGINYAVTSPFSFTGTGTEADGFNASIFNALGLYYWDDSEKQWVFDDPNAPNAPSVDPGASYASSISNELGWIQGVVPDVIVPEPGGLALLLSGVVSLFVVIRFARRRKSP